MKLEELNSAIFVYETHATDFGARLDLSYNCFSRVPEMQDTELLNAIRKYAVGYCRGERLCYKPQAGIAGIMCEKDGEKFWFHIMEETLDYLLDEDKSRSRYGISG